MLLEWNLIEERVHSPTFSLGCESSEISASVVWAFH